MTNMFKKTLVAAALAGLSVNAMAAVNLVDESTRVAVSTERLSNTTTNFNLPRENFVVELGAEYAVGDIITITFDTDAIAANQFRSTITTSDTLDADGLPDPNVGGSTLALGLLSTTANSVTYRVTEVNGALSTVGQKFTIANGANFAVNAAKVLSNGGLTASYAAQTSNGVAIDQGQKSSVKLVHVASEFVGAIGTAMNSTIDVNNNRRNFVAAAPLSNIESRLVVRQGLRDELNIGTAADPVWIDFILPVTASTVTHTVTGDFSWVVDTDANVPGVQARADVVAITGCAGVTDGTDVTFTAGSMTFDCPSTAAGVTQDVTITFNVKQGAAAVGGVDVAPGTLPTGSYTFTGDFTYNVGGPTRTTTVGPVAAGQWTLNGSQVYIPYMLYGPTAEQTIQLTNKGTQSGDITATAVVNGQTLDLGKVGVSNARTVTSLNSAIRNAMVAKGVNLSGPGNFAVGLTLVTNVPADDVTVYSAYQRGNGDRLVVVNDSNGRP
ncbi:hypothetical protein QWY20_08585 [Alkalimonas sp. MEB108]|uniref:Uncharacterized protein n=1 Tax=Alkalimonas cellulosilytica TaxID=3058395 RepID=A0ABU7J4S6_9GAMM|nr:hypothetical protein [Alkalimonas sp. MEB108]MEE2001508.1 hypothetical protein [Alkalimonas sp. MEB108]